MIDPKGGSDGSGAARIAFRLGVPTPGHADVFAALVDRTPRDLSGRQGLTLAIRGDGVYRIWVQVRDANPASRDGGTEWWFASLRTSPEWKRVAVPFSRLRSINPNTDGKLHLDQVRELVFVIDKGSRQARHVGHDLDRRPGRLLKIPHERPRSGSARAGGARAGRGRPRSDGPVARPGLA